jgi:hypothetical protein
MGLGDLESMYMKGLKILEDEYSGVDVDGSIGDSVNGSLRDLVNGSLRDMVYGSLRDLVNDKVSEGMLAEVG